MGAGDVGGQGEGAGLVEGEGEGVPPALARAHAAVHAARHACRDAGGGGGAAWGGRDAARRRADRGERVLQRGRDVDGGNANARALRRRFLVKGQRPSQLALPAADGEDDARLGAAARRTRRRGPGLAAGA